MRGKEQEVALLQDKMKWDHLVPTRNHHSPKVVEKIFECIKNGVSN